MSRGAQQFSSVKTEGGLLPQDVLSRIHLGDPDLDGTKAATYHLGAHERIGEAANQAWNRLVSSWHSFQEALAKEPEGAAATGLTRERWLLPLFEVLGYGRLPKGTAIEVEEKSYAVSHGWHHSPIHLLGCGVDLDKRQKGVAGAATSSPHGLVQDFLNRSDDHLWGFVSNGYRLRVLRDHHSLTRQAYVEFDLQSIMDGEQYSEFLLLWLLCHQSRVEAETPEECWLERWVTLARDEGAAALDKMREGVEAAIASLGAGFLRHGSNTRLKSALRSGELDPQEYYRQLLRVVYRVIFLFVAEERDALLDPGATEEAKARYRNYYATRRLRDLAEKRRGSPHGDLWRGLALVMEKLDDGYPELGLPALGSMLWGKEACPWLMDAECANEAVLSAIRDLSSFEEGKTRLPVNWRNVGADELGSIYEGLLELHPRLNAEAGTFELDTAAGNERKTTGSYYTPTSLVDCLLDSALEPVLDQACEAKDAKDAEAAILDLKVCDPACGSGHFLVAAGRRIAKRLASLRSEDVEPSPPEVQAALRDVVGRCLYGVDMNPMAVELCKVSLWLEALEPGKPLSFLDAKIQLGNALLGTTPRLVAEGIPKDAFKALKGDDKEVVKRLARRNRDESTGQASFLGSFSEGGVPIEVQVGEQARALEAIGDEDVAAVRRKEALFAELRGSEAYQRAKRVADAWCSAFLATKTDDAPEVVTQEVLERLRTNPDSVASTVIDEVDRLAEQYGLLHWHLAFPDVFEVPEEKAEPTSEQIGWSGGFDLLLGNPPWDMQEVKDNEFFAAQYPELLAVKSAKDKAKILKKIEVEAPALWRDYQIYVRKTYGEKHFFGASGRYPLSAVGRVNVYRLFVESAQHAVSPGGHVGMVIPSGFASDSFSQEHFRSVVEGGLLVSLHDFENKKGIFPSVDKRYRFSLLTLAGAGRLNAPAPQFSFFLHSPTDLRVSARKIDLSAEDIQQLNPLTKTCPLFRSHRDFVITKAIYDQYPILIGEGDESGWSIKPVLMFMMNAAMKSHRSADELYEQGLVLEGCAFSSPAEKWLPLYEGKMVGMYDHRAASIRFDPTNRVRRNQPEPLSLESHQDPARLSVPMFWVPAEEADLRCSGRVEWLLSVKDVTSATNERTAIASVLPRSALTDSLPWLSGHCDAELNACLLANLNAFSLDYVARQKVAGMHLRGHYLAQLAVVPARTFADLLPFDLTRKSAKKWFASRVLEMSYTAWDLEAFGKDCGYEGPPFRWDEERRFLLRCELDAAFFHLYGIERDDVDYIMETFPIVKRKDEQAYGDYRTKLQILEIYDAMSRAIETGEPYETLLDPPPADPRIAHPESTRPDWARGA